MRNRMAVRIVSLVVLASSACTSQAPVETQVSTPRSTSTPAPSSTPIPTATPTLVPSPTSYPWPQEPISIENITELSLFGEWGKGSIKGMSVVGNGDAFYAETLTKLVFFNTETLELLFEIPKPVDFKFSPSYQYLVGVDSNGAVSLGSLAANTSYSLETEEPTDNYTFSFSPAEDLVAVAKYPNGTVRPEFHIINVYDTSNGSLVATLDQGDYSPIPETIVISPNSQYLLVQESGYRKRLGVWDISNQRMVARFLDRTEIPDQPFSPNSEIFATYSDNYVFFWESQTGKATGEYGTGLGWTYDLQFSEDGNYISLNQGAQIRQVSDGHLLTSEQAESVSFPESPQEQTISANLSSQREWLESEGYFGDRGIIRSFTDGGFEIWMPSIDIVWNPVQNMVQPLSDLGYPSGQIYFHNAEVLILTCSGGHVSLFSNLEPSNTEFGTCDRDTRLAISTNSGAVALANGTIIELYNWRSGELISTLRAHQGEIQYLTISDDGSLLASYASGELFVWDLQGEVRRAYILSGITYVLEPFSFSPANDFLIANQGGGLLGVWRLSDGQKLRDLRNPVNVVFVSFIGQTILVAGGTDGDIYFWDYVNTVMLHSITTDLGRLSDLEIFMNERGVFAVSNDGVVKLWGLDR